MRSTPFALAAAAFMTATLLSAPAAHAAPAPETLPTPAPVSSTPATKSAPGSSSIPLLPLGSKTSSGGFSAAARMSGSCPQQKCQCQLTVDNPHKSHTSPHVPNVHSRIACKQNQARIRATADLYEVGFWQESKVAKRGDVTTRGKSYAKTNAARSKCVSGDYHGVGSGYVDHTNGTKLGGTHNTYGTVKC